MKNKSTLIMISGILGFLGVALGAFGAHALEDTLSPGMLETYRTGIMYHLIHTVIIAAIAFWGNEKFYNAALFITSGIVLFSFSLYLYAITGMRWIAFITPFGGISFLIGWILLSVAGIKWSKEK